MRIQTTPLPGAYEPHEQDNFLRDLNKKHNSYRFKAAGREVEAILPQGKGKLLLPGAYNHPSFLEQYVVLFAHALIFRGQNTCSFSSVLYCVLFYYYRTKKNSRCTYSFKNTQRNTDGSLNFGIRDKVCTNAAVE